jgi:hypothetical protein
MMDMRVGNFTSDKYVTDISKHNAREGYILISDNNKNIVGAKILERNGKTFWIEEDRDIAEVPTKEGVSELNKYSVNYERIKKEFDGIRPHARKLEQVEYNLRRIGTESSSSNIDSEKTASESKQRDEDTDSWRPWRPCTECGEKELIWISQERGHIYLEDSIEPVSHSPPREYIECAECGEVLMDEIGKTED